MLKVVEKFMGDMTRADLSKKVRKVILDRQKDLCFYCNRPLMGFYVLDHFVPRSKGGSDNAENRVAACQACDGAKGGRLPIDEERQRLATILNS